MDDLILYELDGYGLWAHPESKQARALAQGVPYENRLLEHTRGRYSGTVVDVGASIGNHSLFWWAQGLEVHAFEPNPSVFNHLLVNLAHNDATVSRYPHALSDEMMHGRLSNSMRLIEDPEGEIVAVRFDDVAVVEDVAMVKIDVEGHEPQVLAGMVAMLERDHPDLYVESHTPQARIDVQKVIERFGYKLAGTFKMGSRMDWWA